MNTCSNCGAAGEHIVLKCARCCELKLPSVYYCSKICQKENWKSHKEFHKVQKEKQEAMDRVAEAEQRQDKTIVQVLDFGESFETREEYAMLCGKAVMKIEEQNYRRAEKLCLKAIELMPRRPDAYTYLGVVYERANQLEKALPLILKALECYEALSREQPHQSWWSDRGWAKALWNALNVMDRLPNATRPTWWTDAELLERSAKAVAAAPQDAHSHALRGRVLSGMPPSRTWECGLRSAADMQEGAEHMRRAAQLAKLDESGVYRHLKHWDELAQKAEGAVERIKEQGGSGARWKASGDRWQLQVAVVKPRDEVPPDQEILEATDPGISRLSVWPNQLHADANLVTDHSRQHGVHLIRTTGEETELSQRLCSVAVACAHEPQETSHFCFLLGVLGDDTNFSDTLATTVVLAYLTHGGQADASDERGMSLLKMGAAGGRAEACKLLLQRGANPNLVCAADPELGSPLMAAAIEGHTSTIRVLLEFAADASLRDFEGRTALELAERQHSRTIDEQTDDEARLRHRRAPAAVALLRQHAAKMGQGSAPPLHHEPEGNGNNCVLQ